jgi:hypothetical protein
VWLDTFVGPLFCDLERELQFIIRTQGDGICAFCKGYSVWSNFFFSMNRRNIDVSRTPLNVAGPHQTQRQSSGVTEQ